jgi:hypothetical protein
VRLRRVGDAPPNVPSASLYYKNKAICQMPNPQLSLRTLTAPGTLSAITMPRHSVAHRMIARLRIAIISVGRWRFR